MKKKNRKKEEHLSVLERLYKKNHVFQANLGYVMKPKQLPYNSKPRTHLAWWQPAAAGNDEDARLCMVLPTCMSAHHKHAFHPIPGT